MQIAKENLEKIKHFKRGRKDLKTWLNTRKERLQAKHSINQVDKRLKKQRKEAEERRKNRELNKHRRRKEKTECSEEVKAEEI